MWLLAFWAEIFLVGALVGVLYASRPYGLIPMVGVTVLFVHFVALVGAPTAVVFLLSSKAANRLMHALNGNIATKFLFVMVVAIIGSVIVLFDAGTAFKFGLTRQAPRIIKEAATSTKKNVLRGFVSFGFFGIPICVLAFAVSPVLFVYMLIVNIVAVVQIYRYEQTMDVRRIRAEEKSAQAWKDFKIRHPEGTDDSDPFGDYSGLVLDGKRVGPNWVCTRTLTKAEITEAKTAGYLMANHSGLCFIEFPDNTTDE